MKKLDRIEKEFPDASVLDSALNLKGNALQSLDDVGQAEEYYKKALALAERRGNRLVAGEALYYLVALLGAEKIGKEANPAPEKAIPYYERYWKDYATGSFYRPQVAVAGLHPLGKVGRMQEALDKLQAVISELAQQKRATNLEEAINSYTDAYLAEHTPIELKQHYYNFPDIPVDNSAAQALLRIAIIGVFEDVLETATKEKDQNAQRQATAEINVLFRDMKNTFKPSELSTFILISLADYLREKTAAPKQSLEYYEEIKGRKDKEYLFRALFGIADVYGRSPKPAEKDRAIQSLRRIFNDAPEKKEKERSLYRIITILAEKGDWDAVEEEAKKYLDKDSGFKKFKPWCAMFLARSYDERGELESALQSYIQAWAAYTGYIEVSAPAAKRILEITWDRNNPAEPPKKSDRQTAYEFGWNYIDGTKHIRAGNDIKEEEKEAWDEVEALVQEYENAPAIINMEILKKQEEEARGR